MRPLHATRMRAPSGSPQAERGSVMLASVLIMALLIFSATTGFLLVAAGTQARAGRSHRAAQALNLAEAGIAKAAAELSRQGLRYDGQSSTALGPGAFDVRITPHGRRSATILARGVVPMPQMEDVVREVRARADLHPRQRGFRVELSEWRWVDPDG